MESSSQPPQSPAPRRRIDSKKLLQSKWTAVLPLEKEKHFVVMRVVGSNRSDGKFDQVELRAVHSGRPLIVALHELADRGRWHQGWL